MISSSLDGVGDARGLVQGELKRWRYCARLCFRPMLAGVPNLGVEAKCWVEILGKMSHGEAILLHPLTQSLARALIAVIGCVLGGIVLGRLASTTAPMAKPLILRNWEGIMMFPLMLQM